MPTKNPRIQVVLEKKLLSSVKKKARQDGISMSLEIREIVKEWFADHPQRPFKRFTGEYTEKLIGKFSMGKIEDLDALLAEQVHGIPD